MAVIPTKFDRVIENTLGCGVRNDDVFLVGYPKSGMVWMQFLLANALIEKRGGDRVNFISKETLAPNLDGIRACDPLNLRRFALRKSPRVYFTHSVGDPRLTRGKVIYLIRDPRDVMASYYHFQFKIDPHFSATMDEFLEQETYHPCMWDKHIEHWMFNAPAGAKIVPVFYESLRANTAEVFARTLGQLNVRFTDEDVERAVKLSDLKAMKKIEKKYPTFRGADDESKLHARKGKAGGWREELTDDQVVLIEQRFGSMMQKVGYELTPTVAAAVN